MTKTRRKNRQRRRKGRAGRYMITLLLGIAIGLGAAYACGNPGPRKSRKQARTEGSRTSPLDAEVPQLQHSDADGSELVKMPHGQPSTMLGYTGFTVSFNPEAHQPNWVAWELTADESRATEYSRKDAAFAPDPAVVGCATLDDYRGSGYDRGHMAAAGDMKWSLQAMTDCFLLSNICPQRQVLNSGAWNKLEEKCREWAVRDSSLLIICGPVLTDHLTATIGESRVAVPERFFKVVLAPHANPPRGIAFIMPNGNVPGGMQAAAVSIDEVEAATGYDFFPTLPSDVQEAIESQCNFPRWSQR